MTSLATDIVDVYIFRRLNARVQFLLLQRRNDVPMAQTWQAFHHEITSDQTAPEAARAALRTLAGIEIDRFYSGDFINQFYDEARDAVVLATVLAVTVSDQSSISLADDFQDAGWFDRDEATARLPFSGQRWAVRHIDEIMSIGESEAELYRFEPTERQPAESTAAPSPPAEPDSERAPVSGEDAVGLEPMPERYTATESQSSDEVISDPTDTTIPTTDSTRQD